MQYLNFGRKYEAAAVTADISRLPGKNCLVRQAQMIGTKLFCEEEESISNSTHSEEESIEILKEKPLTLDEKLEKGIYSKTKVFYCSTKKRGPRFIRKNIRDRRHHKKSDLQSNQYCKRLHSPLGGDVHKSISVNRPALLQSFVLSSPKEDHGTFYKHRVCRHAPDLRINRGRYRSTERFIVKGTRRKMQRTA
ncbi:uncharacterized protein TNCV_1081161 [Trichonephila clavipes]|uniref:Uncharacterized protein n=1 Tax=Trichonephila clavipes TaxID=2585209 RepID=A0A8X6RUS1_TRICX|nr:uncharacterized protein TNCV_1081161 [Trichonephila clavipes]